MGNFPSSVTIASCENGSAVLSDFRWDVNSRAMSQGWALVLITPASAFVTTLGKIGLS
jgi:hypothetical protein